MNVEEFREYCLSLPGVSEKMPFPNVADRYSRDVLCFYVGDKWFCFVNIEVFDFCCIKCRPEESTCLLYTSPSPRDRPGGINGAAGKVRGGEAGVAHEQEVLEQCVF